MGDKGESEKRIIEFASEGIGVKEVHEGPLLEEPREVLVEEIDWEDFPNDVTLEIRDVEPKIDSADGSLNVLRFEVSRIERSNENGGGETAKDAAEFWDAVEREIGIRKTENGRIALNGDMSAKNNLVEFVKYLFDHGHLSESDLPIKSGYKWNLINTEREHQNGERMFQEAEVDDGVWVETKYSRNDIKDKIRELSDEYVR